MPLSVQAVSLDIDAGLTGRPFDATAPGGEDDEAEWDGRDEPGRRHAPAAAVRLGNGETSLRVGSAGVPLRSALPANGELRRRSTINGSDAPTGRTEASAVTEEIAGSTSVPCVSESARKPAQADIESLREALWEPAAGLAGRNGLGGLLRRLPGKGTGLLVCDVPGPVLDGQPDEAERARISLVWWHLAACAEITVAPPEALLNELPPDSRLRRTLGGMDTVEFLGSDLRIDPGQAGFRLWRTAGERDWRDVLALMGAYRALHRHAAAAGIGLWESP